MKIIEQIIIWIGLLLYGAMVLLLLLWDIAVVFFTFWYCVWNWPIWSTLMFYSMTLVCTEGGLRLFENWCGAVFHDIDTGEVLKWAMICIGVGLIAIFFIYFIK